jgi:hypothetical protein
MAPAERQGCRKFQHGANHRVARLHGRAGRPQVRSLKVGDVVEVIYAVSNPGLGLVVFKPEGEPVVPSIIFTAYKVN